MAKMSTLLCSLMLTGTAAFAQIPNASFETWTAHTGYDTPDSWGNLNSLTSLAGVYTCEKGTIGAPSGASYIKLTSKTVPILGVVPGLAVTGTINSTTFSVSGGFAYASRPANITGSWQYMAGNTSDQARVAVLLTKWNTAAGKRDTISLTNNSLTGMVMMWSTFTLPLTYLKGGTPDTALILLSSSGTTPAANSYLYVDNLAFSGSVPSGVVTVASEQAGTTIYPNPAKNAATVYYYSLFSGNLDMTISDITGKTAKTIHTQVSTGSNDIDLNLSGLTKGVYLVNISNGVGTETKKLVIE